jgi:predicted O-methyltransferase YrrM
MLQFIQHLARQFLEKRNDRRNNLDSDLLRKKKEITNEFNSRYRGDVRKLLSALEGYYSISSSRIIMNDSEIFKIEDDIERKSVKWKSDSLRLGGLEAHTELFVAACSFFNAPKILEVGVANGYSSSLFHEILDRNGALGCVHSIDLPSFESDLIKSVNFIQLFKIKTHKFIEKIAYPKEGVRPDKMWRGGVVPNNKYCGWLIPIHLRLKLDSKLFVGNAFNILKELPEGHYDVILLDAMKDEELRIELLNKALKKAKKGSFIIQDGGWRNSAVKRFCDEHGFQYKEVGRVSIIRVV